MKKLLFILILLLSTIFSYSQIHFQTIIKEKNMMPSPKKIYQDSDKYIVCTTIKDTTTDKTGTMLTKLSEYGEILQRKLFFLPDSFFVTRSLLQLENENYLLLSTLKSMTDVCNNYIVFSELDENFEVLSKKKIKFPLDTMNIYDLDFRKGNIDEILCYGYCVDTAFTCWSTFLYKFSSAYDSLLFDWYPESLVSDLEIRNDKIYFIGPYWENNLTILNYSDFSQVTLINIDQRIGFPFSEKAYIEFLSDSTYALYGRNTFGDIPQHALAIMDTTNHLIEKNINIGNGIYIGQSPQYNGMDVNSDNEIIAAVHYPFAPFFYIAKTDNMANIIWGKFYEIEYAPFWFLTLATNDGGAMLMGHDMGYYRDIVVKVDENGNLTHINGEPAEQKGHEIILYPNPGSSELTIQKTIQTGDCELYLYNITGKLILQQNLNSQITEINTQALETGIYIYKIISENQVIETGKWVKE